jgi:hypothetical protein
VSDTFSFSKDEEGLISGIEVFKTGEYRGKNYTEADLDEYVSNFNILKKPEVGFEPPVRVGHRSGDDSVKDSTSVIGYVQNLYRKGKKLLTDVKITEPDQLEKIKRGTLKKRSSEFGPYEDNSGNMFDKVFWGFGFVDIPQVEGMADVAIFSKKVEVIDFVKEAKDIIQNGKVDKDIADKVIAGLKTMASTLLSEEKYWDAQNIVDSIITIDRIKMGTMEMLNKEGDKMEKVELTKEQVEKFEKDTAELETLRKTNADNTAKLDEFAKEQEKVELAKRSDAVKAFAKDCKSIADTTVEEAFVATLSAEQFTQYSEMKNNQPTLVKLDAEAGTTENKTVEETEAEAEKKQAVEKAEELTKRFNKSEK